LILAVLVVRVIDVVLARQLKLSDSRFGKKSLDVKLFFFNFV